MRVSGDPLARNRIRVPGPAKGNKENAKTYSEQHGRPVFAVSRLALEHLHDAQARVESDKVGERERAHRVVHAEFERRVDVLLGPDARFEGEDRLVDERHQEPVRDEAYPKLFFRSVSACIMYLRKINHKRGRLTWSVGRLGDGLAHPFGKLARSRQNGRVGLECRDELDQLHDRDRVDYK